MTVAVAHQINTSSEAALAAAVSEAALRGTTLVVLHVVTSKDLDSEEALRQGIGDLVAAAVAGQGAGDLDWEVRVAASDGSSIEDTAGAILDATERRGPAPRHRCAPTLARRQGLPRERDPGRAPRLPRARAGRQGQRFLDHRPARSTSTRP